MCKSMEGRGGVSGTKVVRKLHTAKPPAESKHYQAEISQMMSTFGDADPPNLKSVKLVEHLVKGYVRDVLLRAQQLAGSGQISLHDVLFSFRHHPSTLHRIRRFLYWKHSVEQPSQRLDPRSGPPMRQKEIPQSPPPTPATVNTSSNARSSERELMPPGKRRRRRIRGGRVVCGDGLNWLADFSDSDVDSDTEGISVTEELRAHLMWTDSVAEQIDGVVYTGLCKQRAASFTYSNSKKFRTWAEMDTLDAPYDEDLMDVLGLLAWRRVGLLTQIALLVQKDMNPNVVQRCPAVCVLDATWRECNLINPTRRQPVGPCDSIGNPAVEQGATGILTTHIREAHRRLTARTNPSPAIQALSSGRAPTPRWGLL